MNWPAEFLAKNSDDPAWLAALPDLIGELARRWDITLEPFFPHIGYNFAAPGRRSDGAACVLKVSRHLADTRAEIAALRMYGGDGACRLLAADEAKGALVTERLFPGTTLSALADKDDDAATLVAARLLGRLWRPAGTEAGALLPLGRWCAAFDRNRGALSRGASGFPEGVFRRADELRAELLRSTGETEVIHGDWHHFNILRAEREEWLSIDPKGLAGDRHFDVYQFLGNPNDRMIPLAVQRRRLDIFCHELGLDRRRVKDWCLVTAVLNACWEFEEGGPYATAVERADEVLEL